MDGDNCELRIMNRWGASVRVFLLIKTIGMAPTTAGISSRWHLLLHIEMLLRSGIQDQRCGDDSPVTLNNHRDEHYESPFSSAFHSSSWASSRHSRYPCTAIISLRRISTTQRSLEVRNDRSHWCTVGCEACRDRRKPLHSPSTVLWESNGSGGVDTSIRIRQISFREWEFISTCPTQCQECPEFWVRAGYLNQSIDLASVNVSNRLDPVLFISPNDRGSFDHTLA